MTISPTQARSPTPVTTPTTTNTTDHHFNSVSIPHQYAVSIEHQYAVAKARLEELDYTTRRCGSPESACRAQMHRETQADIVAALEQRMGVLRDIYF